MRMRVEVLATGASTATIVLSQEQVDRLRGATGRGRVPLVITYRHQVFRSSISVYRGQWMMVVNREMRDGGLVPGSSYEVDVTLDTQTRVVEVPADLADALRTAKLTKAFESLAYTHRKEYVRAIQEAKKPETRVRRIEAAIAKIAATTSKEQ